MEEKLELEFWKESINGGDGIKDLGEWIKKFKIIFASVRPKGFNPLLNHIFHGREDKLNRLIDILYKQHHLIDNLVYE